MCIDWDMDSKWFFHLILVIGTVLTFLGTLLFFKQGAFPFMANNHHALVAQNTNTYLGPRAPVLGNPQLVRVQILVYNDPNPKGLQIVEASFDGTDIPLKPRDIYGFRGQASFQKPPGQYTLRWKVQKNQRIWPRKESYEEAVTLDPRDLWIQITITGDKAKIT